jgi:hypothetical protein
VAEHENLELFRRSRGARSTINCTSRRTRTYRDDRPKGDLQRAGGRRYRRIIHRHTRPRPCFCTYARTLAAEDLELLPQHQQFDVLGAQVAATPNQHTEEAPDTVVGFRGSRSVRAPLVQVVR